MEARRRRRCCPASSPTSDEGVIVQDVQNTADFGEDVVVVDRGLHIELVQPGVTPTGRPGAAIVAVMAAAAPAAGALGIVVVGVFRRSGIALGFAPARCEVRDLVGAGRADAVERCSFASLLRFRLRLRRGPRPPAPPAAEHVNALYGRSSCSCVSVAAGEVTAGTRAARRVHRTSAGCCSPGRSAGVGDVPRQSPQRSARTPRAAGGLRAAGTAGALALPCRASPDCGGQLRLAQTSGLDAQRTGQFLQAGGDEPMSDDRTGPGHLAMRWCHAMVADQWHLPLRKMGAGFTESTRCPTCRGRRNGVQSKLIMARSQT